MLGDRVSEHVASLEYLVLNDEFVAQIPKRGLGGRMSEHVASLEHLV